MPKQREPENGRFSAKVEKAGPYRVVRTGYWPIKLQKSRSISVAINYYPLNEKIVRSIRENIWTAVLKYWPNEVRSVRKAKVQIFSRMDGTNWSIRVLLYSHNQHLGFIPDKMVLSWIIMTIYTSNSFSSIFVRILPEYFPVPLSHLKRSFHSRNQNLLKKSLSSILFIYWRRPSIFRSNMPFGGPIRLWTDR